ncbi:EAL domain-containing protein [Pseudomonas sp. GV071]|jgi:diguanylate cyclase (GGDEF)-like protein/PAS domain S-box-containing protein|uniref:EAL domain-containing protein n=1 Tax=Pseudomonas sp. GV071 TaxID=2135754 RepID=UPI000D35CF38|nr:EAL domain-containing protein [Pseudomonas sp. GV071]PTQ70024.1 diguanylate cyclase/phosphodiesterase with PAS/PAC sensor(s) [Pseudomonas sp. GV071]
MRDKRRLFVLVWPFIAIVVLQALLAGISLEVMSSVRAYVTGESLWSKGQKDAFSYLHLYADTLDEADYQAYQAAIAIPLGDHAARLAMDLPSPDYRAAYEGFLRGGTHPQDIPGLIWLYRDFRQFSYLARAVELWRVGDGFILALQEVAEQMHQAIAAGTATAAQIHAWNEQIYAINLQVTPVAKAFSDTLGQGSRFIQQLLLAANVLAALVLILLATLRTLKLLQQREAFDQALRAEKERAQTTLASIGDAVIRTDQRGCLEYMNPAAEDLILCRIDQARGRALSTLFHLQDSDTQLADAPLLERILAGEIGGSAHAQQVVRLDGSKVAVALVGAPIQIAGHIAGAVLVLHDMTRERQYIDTLSWQASHDALTGLANRREFEQRLEYALARLETHPGQHALMFLDLDQFKVVNDTCGHAAGDQLLRQVCVLLQEHLREGDTLARLGGDEFGILLENCPAAPAARIAELLRITVQDLQFAWDGRNFSIGVSIGLVSLAQSRITLAEALRSADMACYMAKEKGRNRVQVYQSDDSEMSNRFGEMAWVQRIHAALEEERFCLYYQQIAPVAAEQGAGAHLELLLRLRDEDGQLVPPIRFIPAAERYGLMPLIDRWVVSHAFSVLAQRQANQDSDPIATCAINLSGPTFGDQAFLGFLREQFALFNIPPQQVCFEITETSAIANLGSAMHFISELKTLGCRFSLDDFGAGMSSFAYLKHLPVDYLKIDGSFVKDMLEDPIDRAMVESINQIGHVMGKLTIAEFVESPAIMQALAEVGVDYAQGYAIAKPLPFGRDVRLSAYVEPLPAASL